MINEIVQAHILPDDLQEELVGLQFEMENTLNTVQKFRTRTEMEVSVLNDIKQPTQAAKYWQAVREQSVMINELIQLSFEYRRNDVRLKQSLQKIKQEIDPLNKEYYAIDIDELNFIMENQRRIAEARMVEILHWSEIKAECWEKMTDFERENPDNHQLESYTKRWINQAKVMGSNGSPSENANLAGQLLSGLRQCKAHGIIDRVTDKCPDSIAKMIGEL